MLRITDARTGGLVDAAPARRGLTRVEAHAPGAGPTGLRVLLVADLLVRALELGGTPVWAVLTAERERAELRAGARALGIRPFEDGGDAGAGPGGARVLRVEGEGEGEGEGGGGGGGDGGTAPGDRIRITVAPVELPTPPTSPTSADRSAPPPTGPSAAPPTGPSADVPPAGPGAPLAGAEPATLRLALLAHRRDTPLRLDAAALDDAGAVLAHWRRAVAAWARRPSRPVPEEVRGRLRTAWEDDLDTPAVLRVLRQVETDADLPDGARFETYAYADRLLGLDLTRDLGSPA
ncbi:hypothetical protein ACIF8T_33545 [Streptomyces sp. NPDC085946]|uniref:hypothetical protein n=1 Tax=Streptomyces sp. NPDC085946 TaxID=3365744 RepID=UPI0037D6762C